MPENGNERIRQVRSNPTIERVDTGLENAINAAAEILASHEPVVKEVHDAFMELAARIQEAEETRADIHRLRGQSKPDQEEVNSILKGAEQTRLALIEAALRAKTEAEK